MSCVAIIPARGGSKGIPRKNLKPVGGVPLVARTVLAALAAKRVTRVIVSTDDHEIAAVAERHGAEAMMRPEAISGDTASSESAVVHCLDTVKAADGAHPEFCVMLQCTSSLTHPDDIDGAIAQLEDGADSCFTASPFHHFLWSQGDDGVAEAINHEGNKRKRRQDMTPQYLENGAVYAMRTAAFVAAGDRFCGKVTMHVVPANRTHEIDDPIDLVVAEVLARESRRSAKTSALPDRVDALVLDFDGVLTDNRVIVRDDGHESVMCSRGDGMGLSLLKKAGVRLLILSKERNPVVARRAEKLDIECLHGVDDKPTLLRKWLADNDVDAAHTIFVGNDINDVGAMGIVGCSACPSDAHDAAKRAAKIVLDGRGGHGAVRELCDLIAEATA